MVRPIQRIVKRKLFVYKRASPRQKDGEDGAELKKKVLLGNPSTVFRQSFTGLNPFYGFLRNAGGAVRFQCF